MVHPLHPEPSSPDALPRLVPGLSFWPLFPDDLAADGRLVREGVSILGSQELDRYVTIPNRKLPAIGKILGAVERSGSRQEIEDRLRREGLEVDLVAFCDRLRTAGLVLDPDGRPVAADSDLERNFVRLGSVSLRRAAPLFLWAGRNCGWILALLVVSAGAVFWRGHISVARLAGTPFAGGLSLTGFLMRFLVLAASFFLHELAHGVVAARFGKPPQKFEAGFYLGFLPTFFLRVGGLYTLPPRQRIAVWSAGSIGNLLVATGAALAMVSFDGIAHRFWAFVMWLNVALGIFNLVPFLPTDGYFITSTLLRRPNLRRQAWSSYRSFRDGGKRPSLVFLIYVAGSTFLITALLFRRLLRIVLDFGLNPIYSAVRLCLIVFFTGVVVFRRRRMKQRTAERPREGVRPEAQNAL